MNDKSSEIPNGWNHPAFDQKGKVICQVCGKKFMILTPSHLKTHGLKYGEYKNKFPDAPITNEEFKAMSKYSKPSKYTEEDIEILGTETVIDEDIPVIDDEFEMPKNQVAKDFDTPMEAKKHEIFNFLADYLPGVKMDYLIQIRNVQGTVIFSVISDFADPFSMINIQFPDTFWHNRDAFFEDPNRNRKLEEQGWKVIEIKSPAPKIKAIEKALRKIM
jgi:hypothetical protein